MVINVSINKTDDSVIAKQLLMFKKILKCYTKKKKILTNQNECTQMRIDLDFKGHELYK